MTTRPVLGNAPNGNLTDNFTGWSRAQMQTFLKSKKLKATGSNSELKNRLLQLADGSDQNNNPKTHGTEKENRNRKRKAPKSPLKDEIESKLRAFGAKVTGSKDKLKARLQLWEDHKLDRTLIACETIPPLIQDEFPSEDFYRALRTLPRSELKMVDLAIIDEWFTTRNAEGSKMKGRKLFFQKYLINIRVATVHPERLHFKAVCASACHKKGEYVVEVCMGFFGNYFKVLQGKCQCVAGFGLSAACKHVAALCYCVEHFGCSGDIIELLSCTSQLQQWHQPSQIEPGRNLVPATVSDLLGEFFPQFGVDQLSTDRFLNNLVAGSCTSAILHSRAVNVCAYLNDFNGLTKEPLEYVLLKEINTVSNAEIMRIERLTRKQSGSKLWASTRCSRVTASIAGSIYKTVRNGNFSECYAKSHIVSKDLSKVPAINWGRSHERDAITFYEKTACVKTEKTGIFIDKNNNFLAASPDGKVDDLLLEVKCPWSCRDGKPTDAPFLHSFLSGGQRVYYLQRSHNYYMQCQLQMHVSGYRHLDFIVWTPSGIFIENLTYNAKYCDKVVNALYKYFKRVFCKTYIIANWARDSLE